MPLLASILLNILTIWPSQSRLSYDKGDNGTKPGAVHRSLGTYFTRDRLKAVRPVIGSNEVGGIAQHVMRAEEGRTERMESFIY